MQTGKEAKEYHKIKNWLFVINLTVSFFLLLFIVISAGAVFLKSSLIAIIPQGSLWLVGFYTAVLSMVFYIIGLPPDFYEGFILEHKFGLSKQTIADYLKDNLKKAAISFVIFIIAVEFLYVFLRRFPAIWWFLAALGWFFLTVLLAKLTPSILLPIFYKYIPLEDTELKNKIMELFSQTKTQLKDVYMIDFSRKTKKANAAVIGFGKNRRVILTDNLLKDFSHDEILCIVAHELGHYKNKDTFKITALGFIMSLSLFFISDLFLKSSFSYFGYEGIADIAGFPLFSLAMLILGLISMPLQNGFIRRLETKADIYSISLIKKADAFISMMEKLGRINLADTQPPKFVEIMLYDHPPIAKRIELARKMSNTL